MCVDIFVVFPVLYLMLVLQCLHIVFSLSVVFTSLTITTLKPKCLQIADRKLDGGPSSSMGAAMTVQIRSLTILEKTCEVKK